MLRRRNNKAQSTAEYVIVLGLIVGAAIAMQTYVKRGFQGKIKDAVDFTDNAGQAAGVVQFKTTQYEPYYLSSKFNSEHSANETESITAGGSVTTTLDNERSSRTGDQTIDLGRADNE